MNKSNILLFIIFTLVSFRSFAEEEFITICGYNSTSEPVFGELKQITLTDPNEFPQCPSVITAKDQYGNWTTFYLLYEFPGGF